jgi:DNA-binding transcriptional MerR regulator
MGNVKLYNYAAQKFEDVPEENVDQLVASGSHQFAGARIPVVSPEGELGTLNREEAPKAFGSGFRYASPTTSQQILQGNLLQQKQELAKEVIGPTGAFAAGALSGATFGLSDIAGKAAGYEEGRNIAREAMPVASTLGEVAGGIGTGFTGVGKAIAKQAAGVGKFASQNVANELAKKVVASGLGSAVEGAYYGLGTGVSEAALGNPEDVVENLLYGGAMGSLFGAGVGAAIPVAGAGIQLAGRGVKKGIESGVETLLGAGKSDDVKEAVSFFVHNPKEREIILNPEMARAQKAAEKGAKVDVATAQKEFKAYDKQVSALVKDASDESKDVAKTANKLSGEYHEMASRSVDDQISTMYDDFKKNLMNNPEPSTNRFNLAQKSMKDGIARKMQESPANAELYSHIQSKIDTAINVTKEELKRDGIDPAVNAGQDALALWRLRRNIDQNAGFGKKAGNVGFAQQAMRDNREFVDMYLKGELANPSIKPIFESQDKQYSTLLRARGALRSKKEDGVAKTMALLGDSNPAYAIYKDKRVQQAIKGDQLTASEAFKGLGKQIFGAVDDPTMETLTNTVEEVAGMLGENKSKHLTEMIEGLRRKGLSNTAIKDILDNPELSPIERAIQLKKALGQPVDELMKTAAERQKMFEMAELLKGSMPAMAAGTVQTAGWMMDKPGWGATGAAAIMMRSNPRRALQMLSTIEKASNTASQHLEKAAKGVASALVKAGPRMGMRSVSEREKAQRRSLDLVKATYSQFGSPEAAAKVTEQMVAPLSDAPQVQAKMAEEVNRIGQIIYNNLPKEIQRSTLTPNARKASVPKSELSKFYRRLDVWENPKAFLDDLSNGRVPTIDEISAFREAYPKAHAQLVEQVQMALAESKTPLSPAARSTAMALLEQPGADSQYTPDTVKNYQKILYSEQEAGVKPANSAKLKIAEDTQTNVQKIAMS